MSTDQDKHDRGRLQHDAEHTRPHKRLSVMGYLAILFAVAFLLLLMSYFSQQRANQDALDQSNSAVESLGNLLQERDSLKEQVAGLEAQISRLEEDLSAAQQAVQANESVLAGSAAQLDALNKLNEIRALYNRGQYSQARELLEQWESAAPGALEAALKSVSDGLSEDAREIYDPLDAYHQLTDWLS